MLRDVLFFVDERGHKPITEFLQGLTRKENAKVGVYLKALKAKGHELRRPMAEYLGEGIYELRPGDKRMFYFFYFRENAVVVHAIRKKTDRIPTGDLELCVRRKEMVEGSGNVEKMDL